ncbi:MAG: glycine zipper family protein [Rhodospirillales bacterium]|nr:glycine zipper family protein [Rhodospirillales bacterium]
MPTTQSSAIWPDRARRARKRAAALAAALGLSACTVSPPTGPSFAAMPGSGKSFDQFRSDDFRCRQIAAASIGNVSPGQAATQSGVASAAVGTGVGAAAGALLGAAGGSAGTGAAIGAGAGLLGGGALGLGAAQASSGAMQRSYDITYAQCMTAAGENVPDLNAPAPYGAYPYPPPMMYAPPAYWSPHYGWGGGW